MRKILDIKNCLYCGSEINNPLEDVCSPDVIENNITHTFIRNTNPNLSDAFVGYSLSIYLMNNLGKEEKELVYFTLNEETNLWQVIFNGEVIKKISEINKEIVDKIVDRLLLLK